MKFYYSPAPNPMKVALFLGSGIQSLDERHKVSLKICWHDHFGFDSEYAPLA